MGERQHCRSNRHLASLFLIHTSESGLECEGRPVTNVTGALITVCSAIACILVLFSWIGGYRNVGWIAEFPMLVVPLAWVRWLALLS